MHTYSIALPDGTVSSRKSKRTYTHAVVVYSLVWDFMVQAYIDAPAKSQFSDTVTTPGWGVLSYAGSLALANKAAAAASRRCFRNVQVVEVNKR